MLRIGSLSLSSPCVAAPIAGITDSAFRLLVKRQGGCGLVVTEMVSSEGLVRRMGRTIECAEFTEDERPVAVQLFGGDPSTMAAAARAVEDMGADVVDVNMGCPVPKVTRHHAGCDLMREPDRAAAIVEAMTRAVSIPVTVKMRAGWNEQAKNAAELARMVEAAGAAAVCVHGRTAAQAYGGRADWALIEDVAASVRVPVLGSGDCVDAAGIVERLRSGRVSGVQVGRGLIRNPWILAQASDLAEGRAPRAVTTADRAQFLRDYVRLSLDGPGPAARRTISAAGRPGLRRRAPGAGDRDRLVVQKLRALVGWFSRGLESGSHLRAAVNAAESVAAVLDLIDRFLSPAAPGFGVDLSEGNRMYDLAANPNAPVR
jgi:tRNA-dihydrouridine synthase B